MKSFEGWRRFAVGAAAAVVVLIVFAETRVLSQESFEVASVKPINSSPGGGRGASAPDTVPTACIPRPPQVTPGRLLFSSTTLQGLIALAYGKSCGLISGGPEWMRTDRFEIQARIPEGSSSYTSGQLQNGSAPKLQLMIQTLLADRFKVALHRETREMPVYNLIVVKEGVYLKLSEDQNPPDGAPTSAMYQGFRGPGLGAPAIPISRLASLLSGPMGRPIIDQTNLKGLFDVRMEYDAELLATDPFAARLIAMEEQLGLKLESARAPVEVLVIDRAEKPSEN